MVNWIWFGFMLLALATGIVLVPDSVLERLTVGAAVPAGAAARSAGVAGVALWLALGAGGALLLAPQPAAAQMRGGSGAEAPEPAGAGRELAGAQHRLPVPELPAQPARMRVRKAAATRSRIGIAIRQLLNQGRTREQVVEYFIKKYGGQVALAAPLNRGFNRLAWLFPYSLAALAACGLGYGA